MIDVRDPGLSHDAVIRGLELRPHPEGGHYRETWRDAPEDGSRGVGTAIHFLLGADEVSAWHRVDAAEPVDLAGRLAAGAEHLVGRP